MPFLSVLFVRSLRLNLRPDVPVGPHCAGCRPRPEIQVPHLRLIATGVPEADHFRAGRMSRYVQPEFCLKEPLLW